MAPERGGSLLGERRVTLRDGRSAIVRARAGDADGLIALDVAVATAGEGVVMSVREIEADAKDAARQLEKWIRRRRVGAMGELLVGVVDGRIVGEGRIRRHEPSKVRHVARASIGVHPDAQGVGLGRALMIGLLDWARATRADADKGVNTVSLSVFAENARGVALYASLGFRITGVRRREIREADGREHDDVEMSLLLDEQGG